MQGVSLTHFVLASLFLFLSREFLLHTPCWFLLVFQGRFSHISHAGFIFIWGISLTHPANISRASFTFICGISLTHPMLPSFLYGESFSYTSRAVLIFMQGVSISHPCFFWLHFYLGCFCYTSRAGFIFIWEVSLTHPVLA